MRSTESSRMYRDREKKLERQGWIDRLERAEQRAPELQAYGVEHEGVSNEEVDAFKSLLQEATKEEEIQQFLKKHPALLLQSIIGHRGCVCIPKQKLNRKVTDFLIAWVDSMGFWWLGVELENPRAQMFTERGDLTKELTHAIGQIQDWRIWLSNNGDFARRPIDDGGYSLIDIEDQLPSFIFMGRRKDQKYHNAPRRRQIYKESGIAIHPYDWLIDQVRQPYRRSQSKRSDGLYSEYVEW